MIIRIYGTTQVSTNLFKIKNVVHMTMNRVPLNKTMKVVVLIKMRVIILVHLLKFGLRYRIQELGSRRSILIVFSKYLESWNKLIILIIRE